MQNVQTIDNYKLTSLEEPTDEVLEQLMHEAFSEARERGKKAHEEFFAQLREKVQQNYLAWMRDNTLKEHAEN